MTLSVGVDIGGTKIAACAVDRAGAVAHRALRDTPAQDPEAITEAVAGVVRDLSDQAGSAGETVGTLGVACAGFVDVEGSTILFAANLAWRHEPMQARLEQATGLPVVLENDANAAAWGEYRFGAAAEVDDMLLVTVGTGVGGGVIIGDRVLRGAHGVAAEIGHLQLVPDGHRCGCGKSGCFEQYASGNALVREARELVRRGGPHAAGLVARCGGNPETLEGAMVTEAALGGDLAATELFQDLGRWLGVGIADLVEVLDPARIVIGGGVAAAGELLVAPARESFMAHLSGRSHRPVAPVVLASLGNDAGMIGAADLALARRG